MSEFTPLFLHIDNKTRQFIKNKNQVWTKFTYSHVGPKWADAEHFYSPDKDSLPHCYNQLSTGQNYLVISKKSSLAPDVLKDSIAHRWVWVGCIELTREELLEVYKSYTHHHDIRKAIIHSEALVDHRNNKQTINSFFTM